MKVDWNIEAEDIGINHNDYSGYRVIEIHLNEITKEIWSITYAYDWNCGDGCCSSEERGIAYVGEISEDLKKRLLEFLPDYKLQIYKWSRYGG